MDLPGLICPKPEQTDLIDALANMMGACFLEEPWTREALSALDGTASESRKLELSQKVMRLDFACGAKGPCCYALPDLAACAGAYLRSDLEPSTWDDIETEATAKLIGGLSPEEAMLLASSAERLKDVSDYAWEEQESATRKGCDFIHFYALGVDARKRHSGAFRRLVEPFFAYADAARIPCYLETYSEELENLYRHMGFETIEVRRSPQTRLVERCMRRPPEQR